MFDARIGLLKTLASIYKKSDFSEAECMVCMKPTANQADERWEENGKIHMCDGCLDEMEKYRKKRTA